MRIALGIEYDGSHFCGWQMQSHGSRTVQEELEKALSIVADQPIQVVCAGRTDTGVHATGQVVHFDTTAVRQDKAWILGVNAHLPVDVAVVWSCPVDDGFSARFTATARHYRYVILNRRARPAILHNRVCWRHDALDADAMHAAAQVLIGEQDFSAFRSAACQAEHARRCIHYVNVQRKGEYLYIDIQANAFLHHMVRNIVGSLMVVGSGEKPETWIAELLHQRDRTLAGATAPAQGLYLVKVCYPDTYAFPQQVFLPEFV